MAWTTWLVVATSLVALHGSAFVIRDEDKDAGKAIPQEQAGDAFNKYWQVKLGDTENTYKKHEINPLDLGKVMSVQDQIRDSKEKIYNAEFGVDQGNTTDDNTHKELSSKEDRLRNKYGEEYLDKEENLLDDNNDRVDNVNTTHEKQDKLKDENLEEFIDKQENELDKDMFHAQHEEDDIEIEEHKKDEILKDEDNLQEANSEEHRAREIAEEYSAPHIEENQPKGKIEMNKNKETENAGLETGNEKVMIGPIVMPYAYAGGLELSSPEFDEDRERDDGEYDEDDKREATSDVKSNTTVNTAVATSKHEDKKNYGQKITELVELAPVYTKHEESDQQNKTEEKRKEAVEPLDEGTEETNKKNKTDAERSTTLNKTTDQSEIYDKEIIEVVPFTFDNAGVESSDQQYRIEEKEAKEVVDGIEVTNEETDGESSTTLNASDPSEIYEDEEIIQIPVKLELINAREKLSDQENEAKEMEAQGPGVESKEEINQENKTDAEGSTTQDKTTNPIEIYEKEIIEVVKLTFDDAVVDTSDQLNRKAENDAKEDADGKMEIHQGNKVDVEKIVTENKAIDTIEIFEKEIIEVVKPTFGNAGVETSEAKEDADVKEESNQENKTNLERSTAVNKATYPSEVYEKETIEVVKLRLDNAGVETSEQQNRTVGNEAKEDLDGKEEFMSGNKPDVEISKTQNMATEPIEAYEEEIVEIPVELTFDNNGVETLDQQNRKEEKEGKEDVDSKEETKKGMTTDVEENTTQNKATEPIERFLEDVIEIVKPAFVAGVKTSDQQNRTVENEANEDVDGKGETKSRNKTDVEIITTQNKATEPFEEHEEEIGEIPEELTFDNNGVELSDQQNRKENNEAREDVDGMDGTKQGNKTDVEGRTTQKKATELSKDREEGIIETPVKRKFINARDEQSGQENEKEKEAKGPRVENKEEANQGNKTNAQESTTQNNTTDPSESFAEDVFEIVKLALDAGDETSDEQNGEEKKAKEYVDDKEGTKKGEVHSDVEDNTTLDKAVKTSVAAEVGADVMGPIEFSNPEIDGNTVNVVNSSRQVREARYPTPWSKTTYQPGWGESHVNVERFSQPGWNVNMVTAAERPLNKQISSPFLTPLPISRSWPSNPYIIPDEKNVPGYRFLNGKFVQTIYASHPDADKTLDADKPNNVKSKQDEQGLETSNINSTAKISATNSSQLKSSQSQVINKSDLDQNLEAQPSSFYPLSIPQDYNRDQIPYFDQDYSANSYPTAPTIVPIPVFYSVLPIPIPFLIPGPGPQLGLPPPPPPPPAHRPLFACPPFGNNNLQPSW